MGWKKYLKNNALGVEHKSSGEVIKELINEKNIDAEVVSLFKEAGFEIQLYTTHKVRSMSSGSKYYKKLPKNIRSNKRLLFDADYYWYKLKN